MLHFQNATNRIFSSSRLFLKRLSSSTPPNLMTSSGLVLSRVTEDIIQQSSQAESYSLWLVNWPLCVKSVKWPFNRMLIRHDLFIVVVVNDLILLRLLEVPRLLHFTPAPHAAGVVTPLTSSWMSWAQENEKERKKTKRKSDSTLFSQGKRQGQTAEFEINQKLALSTGATFRLRLRFDLGSSFQWVLTSQSCEESRAGSLQRGFQWYSIYKARGSGSAATDGTVHGAFNYFSQHSWK